MGELYCICYISIKFFFFKEEEKSITVLREGEAKAKATGDLDSNELTSISMTQLGEYEHWISDNIKELLFIQ